MDFLSCVAEVSREWDELNAREVGRMKSQPNAKHLVEECPTILAAREMFGDYNTYNSNYKNHPNFSGNHNYQLRNPSMLKSDNLQYQISRLTNLNTVQEKGNFPSQPYQNPKGIHKVEAQKGETSMVREVKVVMVDQPHSSQSMMKGYLNPQICLLLYPFGRGEKKCNPYSMRCRYRDMLRRSPKAYSSPATSRDEICILGRRQAETGSVFLMDLVFLKTSKSISV
ncbi:hypothetical protein CK203_112151 [Vitis vinifera]|uniref:Uncharacterized protein n=1 Tax=Vitis vinifera TaxID=29760 RepID=A0A438CBQ5_VITVI|nr:hypothetical protein CK203_112151 [Vitis vinifera]